MAKSGGLLPVLLFSRGGSPEHDARLVRGPRETTIRRLRRPRTQAYPTTGHKPLAHYRLTEVRT